MYPILRPILNRGGAGRSATREETVEALNPLVLQHARLLRAYNAVLAGLADRDAAARLETVMNRLRTELGKLRETVLANGGTPPSTVGLRAEIAGDSDRALLEALEQAERAYRQALRETLAYPHHQMRTIAILENNLTGSEERLGVLRPLVDRASSRRARPAPVPADEATGQPADLPHTALHAGPEEQPATQRRDDG